MEGADGGAIPSISTGAVGSRFVSEHALDDAKARRDAQWKAAYARLGQEPPPQPKEDAFDGRSLAEKLAANRAAKQDEWEERNRLANQFRALEADEVQFLDSIRERELADERERAKADADELDQFKAAVAARESAAAAKPPPISPPSADPPTKAPAPAAKPAPPKKKAIAGIVKKKKPPTPAKAEPAPIKTEAAPTPKPDEDEPPAAKRRKV